MNKILLSFLFAILSQIVFSQNSNIELKLDADGFSSIQFDASKIDFNKFYKSFNQISTNEIISLGWNVKMTSKSTQRPDIYSCLASKQNITDLTLLSGEKEPLNAFIYFEIYLEKNTITFKIEVKELYNNRFNTDNLYLFFDQNNNVYENHKEDVTKLENELNLFINTFIKQLIH